MRNFKTPAKAGAHTFIIVRAAWKWAPAFAGVVLLTACSGSVLGKATPSPDLYTLTAEKPSSAATRVLPVTLKIALPHVAPGLETARIPVKEATNQLTYYTGVAWPAALPQMAQNYLADSLQKSGAFKVVGTDADPMKSDYTLLFDILQCEVDKTAATQVKLRLILTLVHSETREALGSLPVERAITPEGSDMKAIASAFNRAFAQAADEALAFTVTLAEKPPLH